MAVLIVILTVLVSAISGVIGAYVGIKYFCIKKDHDDLQMQIDYLRDMFNGKCETAMESIKRIDMRETDHWNFINLNTKWW